VSSVDDLTPIVVHDSAREPRRERLRLALDIHVLGALHTSQCAVGAMRALPKE